MAMPEAKTMRTRALAGWFGANRMLAKHVGKALARCSWVGIPFAGGMSELPHIGARTVLVNDLHRHVINLARVVANDSLRPELVKRLSRKAFHPDELANAQIVCQCWEPDPPNNGSSPDLMAAENYFVCCWMGRGGKAGIDDEFNGRVSVRWNSDGGDSAVRYWSALRSLAIFSTTLKRCTFETMDAFDFIARAGKDDVRGHGLYLDPPFPGAGRRYKHNAGQTDAEERAWHTRLRDAVVRFKHTRIVLRFYEHELIRELYPSAEWEYRQLAGRKQSNVAAEELLLVRNAGGAPSLFD